jgi:hypothetical protein
MTVLSSVRAALFLCAVVAVPVTPSHVAASSPSGAFVAIHAGTTASFVRDPQYHVHSSVSRIGGSAGLLVVIPRTRHSSLQIGTMVRTAGGRYSYDTRGPYDGPPSPRRTSIELTYLAFPVGVRISPSSRTSGPFLAMGADVAYLLTYYQRDRVPQAGTGWSSNDRSLAHLWAPAGFVALGTAFSAIRHRLFSELTYRHGFPPFQKSTWSGIAPDNGTDRALSLSVGVWL